MTDTSSALSSHEWGQVFGPRRGCGAECEALLRTLPDWFGIESSIVEYGKAIEDLDTFLALDGSRLLGFMSVHVHFETAAELHVLAVAQDSHRKGIGRALLEAVEEHGRATGIRFLQVKTLSPGREWPPYEETRRFYLGVGFEPLEEFPLLWGEENPALQLIKFLG